MKKTLAYLLLFTLIYSCDGQDESPDNIERLFFENAELSQSDNAGVYPNWNKGDKTIFRFTFQHPDDPNISDDELSEVFWIEIPSTLEEFSIEEPITGNSEFEMYYTRSCFCYIPNPFDFSTLKASGRKISNKEWNITFEIVAVGEYGEYDLKDSGRYGLSTFSHD